MLVLNRKVGERVVIADNIEVCIVKVAGNRVSLGFEAPRIVPIKRAELTSGFSQRTVTVDVESPPTQEG